MRCYLNKEEVNSYNFAPQAPRRGTGFAEALKSSVRLASSLTRLPSWAGSPDEKWGTSDTLTSNLHDVNIHLTNNRGW